MKNFVRYILSIIIMTGFYCGYTNLYAAASGRPVAPQQQDELIIQQSYAQQTGRKSGDNKNIYVLTLPDSTQTYAVNKNSSANFLRIAPSNTINKRNFEYSDAAGRPLLAGQYMLTTGETKRFAGNNPFDLAYMQLITSRSAAPVPTRTPYASPGASPSAAFTPTIQPIRFLTPPANSATIAPIQEINVATINMLNEEFYVRYSKSGFLRMPLERRQVIFNTVLTTLMDKGGDIWFFQEWATTGSLKFPESFLSEFQVVPAELPVTLSTNLCLAYRKSMFNFTSGSFTLFHGAPVRGVQSVMLALNDGSGRTMALFNTHVPGLPEKNIQPQQIEYCDYIGSLVSQVVKADDKTMILLAGDFNIDGKYGTNDDQLTKIFKKYGLFSIKSSNMTSFDTKGNPAQYDYIFGKFAPKGAEGSFSTPTVSNVYNFPRESVIMEQLLTHGNVPGITRDDTRNHFSDHAILGFKILTPYGGSSESKVVESKAVAAETDPNAQLIRAVADANYEAVVDALRRGARPSLDLLNQAIKARDDAMRTHALNQDALVSIVFALGDVIERGSKAVAVASVMTQEQKNKALEDAIKTKSYKAVKAALDAGAQKTSRHVDLAEKLLLDQLPADSKELPDIVCELKKASTFTFGAPAKR